MKSTLLRWSAPLLAGALVLLLLAVFMVLRFHWAEAGLAVFLDGGMAIKPVRAFGIRFTGTLLLPFYLLSGLVLWGLTLAWTSVLRRGFSETWRFREGFLFTLAAFLWAHLVLWWEVPTTLWLLPGLRSIPFWLLLPLLLAATLAYPLGWLARRRTPLGRGALLMAGWLCLWSLAPLAPRFLPRFHAPAKGGQDPTQVLVIGLDGLRHDVGERTTASWVGTTYDNAYTVIPATRLLWHILWGGDPLYYTVGHAPPALEEYQGTQALPLIDRAAASGWKPRFYIDDGGTIGLAGRPGHFDDVLMPAAGWENFVNSNLSASFPLFAAWEDWGRAFPTTNPWASLDGGLKEALRLGRGSRMVMFHSCLAHIPIFLRREELARVPGWWHLSPRSLEPYVARPQLTPERMAAYDQRRDPFRAYTIRMESILKAWEPIWNRLAQDPSYGQAVRVLFSDHGERFYHVTDQVRLSGIHGYNLDPWETRIMLKAAGPGFDAGAGGASRKETVSVLSLRDAIARTLDAGPAAFRKTLEEAYPEAPMRYHCLDLDLFTDEPAKYRKMPVQDLSKATGIAPGGIWFTRYDKPASERAEEVTVAWGRGDTLEVFRPLEGTGAHRYLYEGFLLKSVSMVSEEEYKAQKEKAKKALKALS